MTVELRAVTQQRGPRQRGITLMGLLLWAIVIGFLALLALRVLPTVNEYLTIQKTINKIAAEGLSTVPEIRSAFEKQKDIEYSISSISGKDLEVTKENDQVVIRYAYNKEVEIMSPVFLLIKYQGSSRSK
ncbi:DUF4845 domain-containing protein [Piscinibacter sp.]|uniref:DUF4845 domain-containing protein n=1 Tax=Piscinibacter sp. TaxID=1903157 RepID=UPI002F3FF379